MVRVALPVGGQTRPCRPLPPSLHLPSLVGRVRVLGGVWVGISIGIWVKSWVGLHVGAALMVRTGFGVRV